MNSLGYSSDDEAPLPKHKKRIYMNQPHLRFEITSDDGFSVKANSIEGKNVCVLTAPTGYGDFRIILNPHSG